MVRMSHRRGVISTGWGEGSRLDPSPGRSPRATQHPGASGGLGWCGTRALSSASLGSHHMQDEICTLPFALSLLFFFSSYNEQAQAPIILMGKTLLYLLCPHSPQYPGCPFMVSHLLCPSLLPCCTLLSDGYRRTAQQPLSAVIALVRISECFLFHESCIRDFQPLHIRTLAGPLETTSISPAIPFPKSAGHR